MIDVSSIENFNRSLNSVWKLRNDIEHYYTSESENVIKEVLADSYVLVRDFLLEHLNANPIDELGEKCWQSLLKASEIFEEEKSICPASMNAVDWKYLKLDQCTDHIRCKSCISSLIRTDENEFHCDMQVECVACGEQFQMSDIVEAFIDSLPGDEEYDAAREGYQPPYDICAVCSRTTYVYDEEICLAGEEPLEYQECSICSVGLTPDEQALEGLCGSCNHRFSKIMME